MIYARVAGILFLSMLGSANLASAQTDACHVDAFIKHIGYERIFVAQERAAIATARLAKETRCEYRPALAACLGEGLRKVRAYRSLRRSADGDNAVAMEEIDRNISQLINLLSELRISYTVIAGRVYGVSFKDIEAQGNFWREFLRRNESAKSGWDELQNPKFKDATREACNLGVYDDNTFASKMDEAVATISARVRNARIKDEQAREANSEEVCRRLAAGKPQTGLSVPYDHFTEKAYKADCARFGINLPPPS